MNYGSGRLQYVGPVPVLRVEGTPEEVGRQAAELALRPAARLLDYPLDLLTRNKRETRGITFAALHLTWTNRPRISLAFSPKMRPND